MKKLVASFLVMSLTCPVYAQSISSGGGVAGATIGANNFASSQHLVTNTASLIVAARPGRIAVTIQQLGSTFVYLGMTAGVTTSTGIPLLGTPGASITLPVTSAIYGIVPAGTQNVSVAETY